MGMADDALVPGTATIATAPEVDGMDMLIMGCMLFVDDIMAWLRLRTCEELVLYVAESNSNDCVCKADALAGALAGLGVATPSLGLGEALAQMGIVGSAKRLNW